MKPISKALEAWRQAVRDLEATTPRTTEWLQALTVENDRRAAYQAATHDSALDPSACVGEPVESDGETPANRSTASPTTSIEVRPSTNVRPAPTRRHQ
jgi:hypothetical protein